MHVYLMRCLCVLSVYLLLPFEHGQEERASSYPTSILRSIFPVANRPDFLWLSASLEWLREAWREAGGGGPKALDLCFLLPRGQATKVFLSSSLAGGFGLILCFWRSFLECARGKAQHNQTSSRKENGGQLPFAIGTQTLRMALPERWQLGLSTGVTSKTQWASYNTVLFSQTLLMQK